MKDSDLATLAEDAYSTTPTGQVIDFEDLRVVITDGVIAVRGTIPTSWENWIRDFDVALDESDFGLCHEGFLYGAKGLLPLVEPHVTGDYTITGHSLGGAIAIILGAFLIKAGKPPIRLVTFEAPKAGGSQLKDMYSNIPVTQYKYGNDPVPDVPYLPGFYEQMTDLTLIGEDMIDPISCHDIAKTVDFLSRNA